MRDRSILVVDDTANIKELLASALNEAGFKTSMAGGGNEAIEVLAREKVDLVITDLRMEHGTGIELIRRLRRSKRAGEAVPEIVVYTGLCSKEGESYLRSLGARQVWLKEVSPKQLVVKLIETKVLPE